MVTLKEAREVLGEKYNHVSDDQITLLLNHLTIIGEKLIHSYLFQKSSYDDDMN